MRTLTSFAGILALGLRFTALAQTNAVPPLINYQGRLTDDQGKPLASGSYRLAFRLWANATSAASTNLVWGREFEATVIDGMFNIILNDAGQPAEPVVDSKLPISFSAPDRFLGLTILRTPAGSVPVVQRRELLPRQQLLATPYAIEAQRAAGLAKELAEALCPSGSILSFGGENVPDGWLLCDGRAVSSKERPRLFNAIGTAWGNGSDDADDATDINLPDLRATFLGGLDNSTTKGVSGRDPEADGRKPSNTDGSEGNRVGSIQMDALQGHAHQFSAFSCGIGSPRVNSDWMIWDGVPGTSPRSSDDLVRSPISDGVHGTTRTAGETRPKNAFVQFIIKY